LHRGLKLNPDPALTLDPTLPIGRECIARSQSAGPLASHRDKNEYILSTKKGGHFQKLTKTDRF